MNIRTLIKYTFIIIGILMIIFAFLVPLIAVLFKIIDLQNIQLFFLTSLACIFGGGFSLKYGFEMEDY